MKKPEIIPSQLVILLLILSLSIFSCNKEPTNIIFFHGRVLDIETSEPIPDYPLRLDFIRHTTSMGLNLGSYSNIAQCVTNKKGEFYMAISRAYAKDIKDKYTINAYNTEHYFGLRKELNAQKADMTKNNLIDSLVTYKKKTAHLTVRHLGEINHDDLITLDFRGIYNSARELFYGDIQVVERQYDVVENSNIIISWSSKRDNKYSSPKIDTVKFTKQDTTYLIEY